MPDALVLAVLVAGAVVVAAIIWAELTAGRRSGPAGTAEAVDAPQERTVERAA